MNPYVRDDDAHFTVPLPGDRRMVRYKKVGDPIGEGTYGTVWKAVRALGCETSGEEEDEDEECKDYSDEEDACSDLESSSSESSGEDDSGGTGGRGGWDLVDPEDEIAVAEFEAYRALVLETGVQWMPERGPIVQDIQAAELVEQDSSAASPRGAGQEQPDPKRRRKEDSGGAAVAGQDSGGAVPPVLAARRQPSRKRSRSLRRGSLQGPGAAASSSAAAIPPPRSRSQKRGRSLLRTPPTPPSDAGDADVASGDAPERPSPGRSSAALHSPRPPSPPGDHDESLSSSSPLSSVLSSSSSSFGRAPSRKERPLEFPDPALPSTELFAMKRIHIRNEKEGFPFSAMREIRLLSRLAHPNLVQLRDVVWADPTAENNYRGDVHLVFNYCEHDLAGLLVHRNRALSLPEIKNLARQLLTGMGYLAKNGVVHRDIKLSNLLLDRRGRLRIADFGLSRFLEDPATLAPPPVADLRVYKPPAFRTVAPNFTNRVITLW